MFAKSVILQLSSCLNAGPAHSSCGVASPYLILVFGKPEDWYFIEILNISTGLYVLENRFFLFFFFFYA